MCVCLSKVVKVSGRLKNKLETCRVEVCLTLLKRITAGLRGKAKKLAPRGPL